MTDPRAQDLPELRAELLDYYAKPAVAEWWSQRPANPAMTVHDEHGTARMALNPSGDKRRLNEIDRLRDASLFFVSDEMTDLAVAAATSLPSFDLDATDVPSRTGLIIFQKPIAVDRNDRAGHGEAMPISGASWNIGSAAGIGAVLWFSFYVDIYATYDSEVADGSITNAEAARQKGAQPRFSYTMDAAHRLGRGIPVSNADSVLNDWGRTILSAWLLMGQPLTEATEVQPERAAGRRLRRAGHEPAAVRLIELRRPKSASGSPVGAGRDYQHRWITRGHWRQQWYPKRQVHRPVWIAPHVKGPEGAPMIGGEKVNVWKR